MPCSRAGPLAPESQRSSRRVQRKPGRHTINRGTSGIRPEAVTTPSRDPSHGRRADASNPTLPDTSTQKSRRLQFVRTRPLLLAATSSASRPAFARPEHPRPSDQSLETRGRHATRRPEPERSREARRGVQVSAKRVPTWRGAKALEQSDPKSDDHGWRRPAPVVPPYLGDLARTPALRGNHDAATDCFPFVSRSQRGR
jgi:hypothetical protein